MNLESRAEFRAQRGLELFGRDHNSEPLRSSTRKNLRAASQKVVSVHADVRL
jgi:hypothetical protein